jgi:hypothetical protein
VHRIELGSKPLPLVLCCMHPTPNLAESSYRMNPVLFLTYRIKNSRFPSFKSFLNCCFLNTLAGCSVK